MSISNRTSPARGVGTTARIAIHVDTDTIGGAERSLETLLRHLDGRFRVDLVVTDSSVGEYLASARKVDRVVVLDAVKSDFDLGAISSQLSAIRRLRPDLVHVNRNWIWAGQSGILGGLLARGAPVIAVEHAEPLPTTSRRLRASRRLLAGRLAALVTVGERNARQIEALIGLPAGSVRTIHNGVEVVDAAGGARADGPPRLGAIGRLSPEKGFEDLPRVLQQIPEARLTLVGEGPERASLEALAAELGVSDRFDLVGWQEEPLDSLRSFDLLLAPSRREGLPLVVLEAMMVGVPVVAADVGGIPEAIHDDCTGVLIPPRNPDAIAAATLGLLADQPRRKRLAGAARERALSHFTAERMAGHFEALYAELLARPASASHP